MEKRPRLNELLGELLAKLRAQRWSREVLLAALLTIAAAVFITAAMIGSNTSDQETTPVETARQPPG